MTREERIAYLGLAAETLDNSLTMKRLTDEPTLASIEMYQDEIAACEWAATELARLTDEVARLTAERNVARAEVRYLRAALAAEQAKGAALREAIVRWNEGVDDEGGDEAYFHSMLRDGACQQCYPDRDIKTVGFVCDYHTLRSLAPATPATSEVPDSSTWGDITRPPKETT